MFVFKKVKEKKIISEKLIIEGGIPKLVLIVKLKKKKIKEAKPKKFIEIYVIREKDIW